MHGTLAEAIVRGHHVFGTELTAAEKEEFWQEWLRLGQPPRRAPRRPARHVAGFQTYVHDMIDNVLSNNDVAASVQAKASRATGGSPFPWLPARAWGVAGRPLGRYGAFLAHGTMGARLRDKFEIPWSPRQQCAVRRASPPLIAPPAGSCRGRCVTPARSR